MGSAPTERSARARRPETAATVTLSPRLMWATALDAVSRIWRSNLTSQVSFGGNGWPGMLSITSLTSWRDSRARSRITIWSLRVLLRQ